MMTIPKWIIGLFIALALVGFIDASYLTAEHLRGTIPPCSLVSGCDKVLTSQYATIAGIPTAVGGMVYYAIILILLVAYLDTFSRRYVHWASWFTVFGLLASLFFLYIQIFVLGAYCLYCLVSAASSILLFILATYTMRID